MSHDPIFTAFLRQQTEEGLSLAAASDVFGLLPLSEGRFIAEFHCKGLARQDGRIVEQSVWHIGIRLPEDYLRRAVDVAEILTYLGPASDPWHPNIRSPHICLHVAPGAPLVEIIMGLYDLITWNLFGTGDNGLNGACSQWARGENPSRFPIDPRPLRRRRAPVQAELVQNEASS